MSAFNGPFPNGWYDDALVELARFMNLYDRYVERIAETGQVPASEEVIQEEARRGPNSTLHVLYRKLAALKP